MSIGEAERAGDSWAVAFVRLRGSLDLTVDGGSSTLEFEADARDVALPTIGPAAAGSRLVIDLRDPLFDGDAAAGLALPTPHRSAVGGALKRTIDVVLAATLLLITMPVLALIGAAIFVSDPGPIFFRQTRIGRDGKPFRILKFRTMVVDAEQHLRRDPELYAFYLANDHKLPLANDPRVTRIGRLLRTTSLDELPQLFNVITGAMSLVGPRPVLRTELRNYGALKEAVLSVRPGMTGLWQVSGRSRIPYPERAHLDATYAHAWSIRRDLAILWRTIGAVVRRIGAE